ncbi:hypothetical protein OROHE_005256 [Orobanche hederae]
MRGLSRRRSRRVKGEGSDMVHTDFSTAQKSLDNVLIDLYKKCGKVDEQIVMLKHKLKSIYLGEAFNGKPTKTAWKEDSKRNFPAAEAVYRKAQTIDPDTNKALNLCHCLIKQARYDDARLVLEDVLRHNLPGSDDLRSRNRAEGLLLELDLQPSNSPLLSSFSGLGFEDDFVEALERVMNEWAPARSRRLPIFEQISQFRDHLAC